MTDSGLVRTTDEGNVLRITLTRPPLSILTVEMFADLAAALDGAGR